MEYVSRVPGPPLDGQIDDLYYLGRPLLPGGRPAVLQVDAAGGARAVAATGGTVPISHIGVAAGTSSTYVAKRFKAVVGVTPKRLTRSYRFSSAVLALDVAAPIDW